MTNEEYYQELRLEGYMGFMAIKRVLTSPPPEGGVDAQVSAIKILIEQFDTQMKAVPVPATVPLYNRADYKES